MAIALKGRRINVLRFRNPGSDIENQIAIFCVVFEALQNKDSFSLSDMESAIAATPLMSAYGFSGDRAVALAAKKDNALNPLKMNVKMYAEVFRLYGWVSPASRESSYPLRFTLIGACAGASPVGAIDLLRQSLLGYVNPNEINQGVKFDENIRFFPMVLRSMRDLGGRIYKHELCLGPMSCDESKQGSYDAMIKKLNALRGDYSRLETAFADLCKSLAMQKSSVDNMTRLPIGLLGGVGWINTGVSDNKLYGKSLKCLEITDLGLSALDDFEKMTEIRLNDFQTLDKKLKPAVIRLGAYSALKRAGFDISPVSEQIRIDQKELRDLVGERDLLFSPYQTLYADEVDEALGLRAQNNSIDSSKFVSTGLVPFQEEISSDLIPRPLNIQRINLVKDKAKNTKSRRGSELLLRGEILEQFSSNQSLELVTEYIFEKHKTAKQSVFYPLVADLFSIAGLECRESRAGDNGARWDALIADPEFAIPIEIKSPSEELFLSLKAVRQALENKVVLLSRKTHVTTREITSLAVGYELPNSRAEVKSLIDDIYSAYGIRIGVVGLRVLTRLAVESLVNGRTPTKESIREMIGILEIDL